jgi:hypothetical protein
MQSVDALDIFSGYNLTYSIIGDDSISAQIISTVELENFRKNMTGLKNYNVIDNR